MIDKITVGGLEWVVFPHTPDWSTPVRFTRNWLGADARTLTGAETRLAHSPRPLIRIEYDVVGWNREESALIQARMAEAELTGRIAVPIWGRGEPITSGAIGTSIEIADVLAWGWYAGMTLFIALPGRHNHKAWDMVMIDEVIGGTGLELTTSLSRSYPTGTMIYPVLMAPPKFRSGAHISDHHFAVGVSVEGIKTDGPMNGDFGFEEEEDGWAMPMRPLDVAGEATDETVDVSGENPTFNENGEITIRIRGGIGPYTITPQNPALGGATVGWRHVYPNLGQGTYCFDVVDAAGTEEEICVRVYREEYSVAYGYTNPYVARFTNETAHNAQFSALHYGGTFASFLLTSTAGESVIPPGGSGVFIFGPDAALSGFIGVNGLGVAVPAIFVNQGTGIGTGGGTSGTVVPWRAVVSAGGTVTFTEGPWTETIGRG